MSIKTFSFYQSILILSKHSHSIKADENERNFSCQKHQTLEEGQQKKLRMKAQKPMRKKDTLNAKLSK